MPPKGRAGARIARTGGGVVLLVVGAALLVLPARGWSSSRAAWRCSPWTMTGRGVY